MKALPQSDQLSSTPGSANRSGDLIPAAVLDGEALLPGPRGPVGVTVSVRLFDSVEIWLYAAESVLEHPMRGLWRWHQGRWDVLCGGQGLDPASLAAALAAGGRWAPSLLEPHDEQIRGVLRLAGRMTESVHGTAAGSDGRC
ncbi:hypothetical protein [Azospirillum sp. TSO22-1]|uniref:hypothetical protein n=1 Tax=Azospirillum sp. TSO22-1 TaxID=716789 RepID=UPI000D60D45C|nr:hypothetical protein [Azospirillum sp. TSO22-1]PWC32013.1 hypothetical protein TSO221_31780 [Azospirillum sp. TSO22-1]